MTGMASPAKPPAEQEWAPDAPMLEACRAGQPEAIERLFRTYAPVVEAVIDRLVGPTPDFEDLVQSTFLEAIGSISRFRGEAKLSTWLCQIAVHIANHHLRSGRVRRHVPLELVVDRAEAGTSLLDPNNFDQTIDHRRLALRLHELLDRIAPKKRIALLLYVVEGRSIEEVAALMKATQTATRSRTFFARRELRKLIASDAELRELASTLLETSVKGRA
jgi:RNA polymerase sigma-70 factor (ECF subfamily)